MRLLLRREARLSAVQGQLLEGLRRDGIAVTSVDELFGDGVWAELERDAAGFAAEAEALARTMTPEELDCAFGKAFLIRRYRPRRDDPDAKRVRLSLDDPLLHAGVSSQLVDVAREYRNEPIQLIEVDSWYVVPSADGTPAPAQGWRRDARDEHVVQALLLCSPTKEGYGSVDYVRGSAPGGANAGVGPWDTKGAHIPEDELRRVVDPDDVASVSGPPGTLVLLDASGLSRFGFARGAAQVLGLLAYVSPEAQKRLRCHVGRKFEVELPRGRRTSRGTAGLRLETVT